MNKTTLILALVLYIASAAVSFGAFSTLNKQEVIVPGDGTTDTGDGTTQLGQLLDISPGEPKDQACPLNGQLYTNTERQSWETRRPLAVMIENTPDSRPQSGLANSDIVFEAVAEGGITRFMAMFYCGAQANDIVMAPIRSARTYYVDWASGFNLPLYVHVGGANDPGPADALGQIRDYGWDGRNDLNQFSIGYPTFVRDYNRLPGRDIATEHTMVASSEKLWAVGVKRKWTNMSPEMRIGRTVVPAKDWKTGYTGWSFEDGAAVGTVAKISYDFWSGYSDYAVEWNYDRSSNSYKRSQGGEIHLDLNNDVGVTAKNVIALSTTEKGPIDDKKHMLYTTTGTGDIVLFKNGEAIKGTWSKKTREAELQFLDNKGQPLKLNRGLTWISVLSKTNEVAY